MPYEHRARGAGDLILANDWNAIGGEVERVGGLLSQDEKKETVTLPVPLRVFGKGAPKSPLSVAGGAAVGAGYADRSPAPENGLIVEGSAGIGTPSPKGKLQVIHQEQDANGNALVLGPDSGSNLRLGYHKDYAWVQSHGGRPLKINPLGNDVSIGTQMVVRADGDVGIGTTDPKAKLQVEGKALVNGDLAVRDGARFGGRVGIGLPEPAAELHVRSFMAVGPLSTGEFEGRLEVSGKGAEIAFMRRTLAEWPSRPQPGDRFVWYNPDGTARLWTHGNSDLVTVSADGTLSAKAFKTTLVAAAPQNTVSLANSNHWAGFPGLAQKFSLSQRSTVLVFYQVTMVNGGGEEGQHHLCTRLALDGHVVDGTQAITGNTTYWSPSNLWIGEVDAGAHSVEVQYRTPSGGTNTPTQDWQCRVLKVLILGS